MKKIALFAWLLCLGIGSADAAGRDAQTAARASVASNVPNATSRTSRSENANARNSNAKAATRTTATTTPRTTSGNVVSRSAANIISRAVSNTRTGAPGTLTTRSATNTRRAARSATRQQVVSSPGTRIARAAAVSAPATNTFGNGYNACHDAYFTCMDQFCATQNEKYRRCVCSARLTDIQAQERALSQSGYQIQDFKDLNIDVISKTAAEVKAMISETAGEAAAAKAKDKSQSAAALDGIRDVLASTKSNAASSGDIDIGAEMSASWATSDLTGANNIANLTGPSLYNAVHTQCAELISGNCPSKATLNMVVAAYGMYIENDCAALAASMNKQLNAANTTIRATEREMNTARLENYDAHNSTSINDCVANVRNDITADTACGADFVHCLDVTGKYLNHETGEPIYSSGFYQLASMSSLSGDVLVNPANRLIIDELARKREYAKKSLDTCRDLSDQVWDEFLRQAIAKIYQGQQSKIRQVKTECLDVVNTCYDEQAQSLKNFDTTNSRATLGSQLELSETMCSEKLLTCSNLYGNGDDESGLKLLLTQLHNITDQKIASDCAQALETFAKEKCTPPTHDGHAYPYLCRMYTPGEQMCYLGQSAAECQNSFENSFYYQLATYAAQVCVRPSVIDQPDYKLPAAVLSDVTNVMDKMRQDMSSVLSKECDTLGGVWISKPWNAAVQDAFKGQYTEYVKYADSVGASTEWGLCAEPSLKLSCAAGYYMSKSEKRCIICPSGYFCPGGEYMYDTTRDVGLNQCPDFGTDGEISTRVKQADGKYKSVGAIDISSCIANEVEEMEKDDNGEPKKTGRILKCAYNSASQKYDTGCFNERYYIDCPPGTYLARFTGSDFKTQVDAANMEMCGGEDYDPATECPKDNGGKRLNWVMSILLDKKNKTVADFYTAENDVLLAYKTEMDNDSTGEKLKAYNATISDTYKHCVPCPANFYCPGSSENVITKQLVDAKYQSRTRLLQSVDEDVGKLACPQEIHCGSDWNLGAVWEVIARLQKTAKDSKNMKAFDILPKGADGYPDKSKKWGSNSCEEYLKYVNGITNPGEQHRWGQDTLFTSSDRRIKKNGDTYDTETGTWYSAFKYDVTQCNSNRVYFEDARGYGTQTCNYKTTTRPFRYFDDCSKAHAGNGNLNTGYYCWCYGQNYGECKTVYETNGNGEIITDKDGKAKVAFDYKLYCYDTNHEGYFANTCKCCLNDEADCIGDRKLVQ